VAGPKTPRRGPLIGQRSPKGARPHTADPRVPGPTPVLNVLHTVRRASPPGRTEELTGQQSRHVAVVRCDPDWLKSESTQQGGESWMEFQRSPPGRHLGASLTSLVPTRHGWDGVPKDNLLDRTGAEGIEYPAEGSTGPVPTWEVTAVGSTRPEDTLCRSIAKSGGTTCPKTGGGGAGKWQAVEVPREPWFTGWDNREPGG
jgi:hypothetical protein